MSKIFVFILIFFGAIVSSCSGEMQHEQKSKNIPSSKESLLKANRYLVKSENEAIDNYVRRHQWKMKETGSGLRYMIYEHGAGEKAKKGEVAELNYELSLITGDVISSSKDKGPMIFKIGHGGVESGLEEAILLMKKGDKAKLIIPSHLAHGFMGDNQKIPPRATLIYDIQVINLK